MTIQHRELIQTLFDKYDQLAMSVFQQVQAVAKSDGTAVTALDIKANAVVVAELKQSFPDFGIVSEELPETHLPSAKMQWIIDPLDGTASFSRGYPIWGLGIGLLEQDTPVEGYMRFPATSETFMHCGGESTFNGNALTPLNDRPIQDTRNILVGSMAYQELPLARLAGFKIRNLGSTLYHMACLATNRADAVISRKAYIWDLAPAMPFVSGAGHIMRHPDGSHLELSQFISRREKSRDLIVMGMPETVEQILDKL